jgi:hypothetical protein
MVTRPNSLCGQRYPAPGREGRNNLIKKVVVVVVEIVKTKKQRSSHPAIWTGRERKVLASGRWWRCGLIPSGARDTRHRAGRDVII